MNIAILIKSLAGGGAERSAGLLSKYLAQNHKVYIFLLRGSSITYPHEGEIVWVGGESSICDDVLKGKEAYGIECSISFMLMMNIVNIRTKRGDTVIITHHNTSELMGKNNVLIGKYYKFADVVVACSFGAGNLLIENYDIPPNRIYTVYNFIDQNRFCAKSINRIPQNVYDFLEGKEYALFVGRLTWEKNPVGLVKYFSIYNKEHDGKLKLLIIGDGYLNDEVNKTILELKLERNVLVLPFTEDIDLYFQNAKIFLMTSISEGLPNVIPEAMCFSLPIICVDCFSGPRELLNDEVNYVKQTFGYRVVKRGILVQADENSDTSFFADAISYIMNHEEIVGEIAENERSYMKAYNMRIAKCWDNIISYEPKMNLYATNEDILYERDVEQARIIIIYGAGIIGQRVARGIKKGKDNVFFAVTNDPETVLINGISVKRIDQFKEFVDDAIVLLASITNDYLVEMIDKIQSIGFKRYMIAKW